MKDLPADLAAVYGSDGIFDFVDHAVSISQRQAAAIRVLWLMDANDRCEQEVVQALNIAEKRQRLPGAAIAVVAATLLATAADPASAAGCAFEPQGEGIVTAVTDGRSFRLQDGREIRLAGIEPASAGGPSAARGQALGRMLVGRKVRLRAEDDMPDRYDRQSAFVWLLPSETMVQTELLAQGEAVASASVADKECAATLLAAEATAREAKRGIWTDPSAIKNAESPGAILAGIGRFALVEGKVLSVRQAGTTTYLNFGRNWTEGFAVTIPRRALAGFAAAGLEPKSLENKTIRVRGFVEARNGPRIEALQQGQIELLGGKSSPDTEE